MRRIKFRGRSINYVAANDSYWAYGLLVNDDPPEIECDDGDIYRVNDKTVGQCTGLEDADGREIYEGDIVKVVSYGEESFHVVKYMIDLDYPAFDLEPALDGDFNSLGYCLIDIDTKITVIGNIHDNPELLRLTKAGGFEK